MLSPLPLHDRPELVPAVTSLDFAPDYVRHHHPRPLGTPLDFAPSTFAATGRDPTVTSFDFAPDHRD